MGALLYWSGRIFYWDLVAYNPKPDGSFTESGSILNLIALLVTDELGISLLLSWSNFRTIGFFLGIGGLFPMNFDFLSYDDVNLEVQRLDSEASWIEELF